MSATDKQKQILRELGASHMSLHRFFGSETEVNHQRMEKLLRLLAAAHPPGAPGIARRHRRGAFAADDA